MSNRRGLLIILSSPSGAGKSTLARRLMTWDDRLSFSVSATTRPPRAGEEDGREYYFRSREDFETMIADGDMLEHAEVFGNLYGSPRGPVEDAINAGRDVLFDIDWQGTQQLADASCEDLVSVFILPPSTRDLEKRLLSRAQDSADVVASRMAKASDEISHYREYDYILVNADLDQAVKEVRAILQAERLRRDRQIGLTDFVKRLRAGY